MKHICGSEDQELDIEYIGFAMSIKHSGGDVGFQGENLRRGCKFGNQQCIYWIWKHENIWDYLAN